AELLLGRYAESLLLIHDQQSEILEPYILRENPVRSYQHINLPKLQILQRLLLLRLAAEAREEIDLYGVAFQAIAERGVMLLRKDRGRRQHRYLPPPLHGLER